MNTPDLDNHISMGEFEPEPTPEIDEDLAYETVRQEQIDKDRLSDSLTDKLRDIASDLPEIRRVDFLAEQAE